METRNILIVLKLYRIIEPNCFIIFLFRGSDICLLVYALDDEQSFFNLDIWKREFLYYADIKDPENFPFVLLGNKCDLDERQHQVNDTSAQEWCRANGNMKFFKTSAKNSIDVEAAFTASVEKWLESEHRLDKQMKSTSGYSKQVDLNKHRQKDGVDDSGSCSC